MDNFEKIAATMEIKRLVDRIRNNAAYLNAVREVVKEPDEYGALPLTTEAAFEALSPRFTDLQEQVSRMPKLIRDMLLPVVNPETAVIDRRAIMALTNAELEIKLNLFEDWNEHDPCEICAVFEVLVPPLVRGRKPKRMKFSF